MLLCFALIAGLTAQADTTVLLGQVARDLTGDGRPETLRLVGVGPTVDSLDVTFTIATGDSVIYSVRLRPLTRTIGFDGSRRVLSRTEHRAVLAQFGGWFFDPKKFVSPAAFVDELRESAPGRIDELPNVVNRDRPREEKRPGDDIWQAISRSPVTIFTFSTGGDALEAIGWDATARRFYRLLNCC